MKKLFKLFARINGNELPDTNCGYYWMWILYILEVVVALAAVYGMYIILISMNMTHEQIIVKYSLFQRTCVFPGVILCVIILIVLIISGLIGAVAGCILAFERFKERYCKPMKW